MTIPFTNIPSNLRIPLFFAEIDPRFANTAPATQRTLIVGQILATGTYAPNVPVRVISNTDAISGAGLGSMLAGMVATYRLNDPSAEVWALPLSDDVAGVSASGTLAITGPATASGTLSLYIAGQLVPVAITSGDAATVIATNINAAINAATSLPVTSTVSTSTVTVKARHKGLTGNDIDMRLNFLGTAGGEATPAGVTVTITALTGGTTNPSLTAGITALGDMGFDFIVNPYTDSAALTAFKNLLADSNGRWSPLSQTYGHCFSALRGTAGSTASTIAALNNQHLTVIPFNDSPSPSWSWAAGFVGAAAESLRADPAVPLQYLTVTGILAPPIASRFTKQVRNSTLLYSGATTWDVDSSGNVFIENMVTTYVTNALGNADNSYLEVETMFTLVYVLRFMNARVQTKYSRMKLAADGTRVLPGSNVITPAIAKADIIAAYRELEAGGFVQKSADFAANVIVEKDANNPNRLNVLWPGVLINQLRQFAMLAQFRLN